MFCKMELLPIWSMHKFIFMVMPLTLNYPYWTGKRHLYYKQTQKQVYFSLGYNHSYKHTLLPFFISSI